MARLFVGDPYRLDRAVLARVASLSDDFWVLAEFNLRRNYDMVIIRPVAEGPAVFISVEIKRVGRPLRGSINSPWEELRDGDWVPMATANPDDKNYYWQAVNSANALSEWLRNNAPVFNDGKTEPWGDVRVWPDLLLLSPREVRHHLPLRPDSRYGYWFYDLDRWLEHVDTWRSSVGARLSHADVERLVTHLGLTPAPSEPTAAARPPTDEPRDDRVESLLIDLRERLERMERLLERLTVDDRGGQRQADLGGAAERGLERDRPGLRLPRASRALTDEERDALVAAVEAARDHGHVRSFPTVVTHLSRLLGEELKLSGYRGFGAARALFDQAVSEGVIRYGPLSGPSPTVWLPAESIPGQQPAEA